MSTVEGSNINDGGLPKSLNLYGFTDPDLRVRMLKEEAHSQKLADAAVGLGYDDRRKQQPQDESVSTAMEDIA